MERVLSMVRGPSRGPDPVAEAQELIYDAWEPPPRRALALAREALEISPDYHGFGDENEAILYVADHLPAWVAIPRALAWLRQAAS